MSGRIGLALLTSQHTGSRLLRALAAFPEQVSVGWVLGSDVKATETIVEEHGFNKSRVGKTREWDEVCRDESVDAMLVCSPDGSVNMVRRALKSGKTVFCDRPISLQPSALVACYEEAKQHKTNLSFGFQRRFDPVMAEVKSHVDAGLVGEVQTVYTTVSYNPAEVEHSHVDSDGLFRDCIADQIDTVCWLLGRSPTSVYAVGTLPRTARSHPHLPLSADVVLKFNNAIAILNIHNDNTEGQDNQLRVKGSKGELLLKDGHKDSSTLSTRLGDETRQRETRGSLIKRNETALHQTLQHLIHTVKGEVVTTDDDTSSLNTICVTAACQHALRDQQTVTMTTPDTELPEVKLKQPLWKERPAAWF